MQAQRVVLLALGVFTVLTRESAAQTAADSASVSAFYGEWFASMRQGPERYASFYASVDEMRFLTPTWVVYRSTLRGQRIPKAGGEPAALETKYFDLLRRSDAGRWEVAYRMWSDNR